MRDGAHKGPYLNDVHTEGVGQNVTIVLIGCVTGTVTRGEGVQMRKICVTSFMDGAKPLGMHSPCSSCVKQRTIDRRREECGGKPDMSMSLPPAEVWNINMITEANQCGGRRRKCDSSSKPGRGRETNCVTVDEHGRVVASSPWSGGSTASLKPLQANASHVFNKTWQ